MRTALGKPLTNIPLSVLNKMVSKDVALSLRKFKLNAGHKTPAKRSKSRGLDLEQDSPNSRGKSRAKSEEATGP